MSAPGRVASRTIGVTTFTPTEAAAAIDLIDGSGIVTLIEPLLPSGGRPRVMNVRSLFVGLLLLTRSGQPGYLNRVAALLNALPPSPKRTLGLTSPVTTRMVRVLFRNVTAQLDGSTEYRGKGLKPAERSSRDDRLQELLDLLIAATLPEDAEYTSGGDLAFDATIIDANARAEATKKRRRIKAAVKAATAAGDSTAIEDMLLKDKALAEALGVPTWGEDPEGHTAAATTAKRHSRRAADRDATTMVYKGRLRHSYALHLAVDVPTRDQVAMRRAREADEVAAEAAGRAPTAPVPDPVPLLVRRMVVTASTAAPGKVGADLLTGLPASAPGRRNGWSPSDVVADRGYSNAKPENWHDPMRNAGFHLIHDLHPMRQGHTSSIDGVAIVDGQAYSPGILDYPDLINLKPPPIGASRADIATYQAAVELRRPFLLPRHGLTKPGATIRVACPALRGKLGCPIRGTVGLTISKGVPEVFFGPTAPLPAICTTKTVRLPAGSLAHGQDRDLLFGSREWYDAFTRRRPRVEGANGIAKNQTGPHLGPMRIRVRSRARVSLLVAFVIAALNIAAVEAWRDNLTRARKLDADAADARRSRTPATPSPTGRPSKGRPPARAPAA
jgi:hypothetical protein